MSQNRFLPFVLSLLAPEIQFFPSAFFMFDQITRRNKRKKIINRVFTAPLGRDLELCWRWSPRICACRVYARTPFPALVARKHGKKTLNRKRNWQKGFFYFRDSCLSELIEMMDFVSFLWWGWARDLHENRRLLLQGLPLDSKMIPMNNKVSITF